MTAILGLNAYHGDAAAALLVGGELVAAAEEERFNRIKHVAGFPSLAAAWCLEEGGIDPAQLDHVAIGRDPRANLGAKLRRTLRHGVDLGFLRSRVGNAAQVLDIRKPLAQALGVEPSALQAKFHNVEHHQAHIASAYLVSPFREAAVLSLDGFGDFASAMLAHGSGDRFEVLERVLFPHSLGIFYTAITQWLGFPHYGDEGKVMGLAPYGDPEPHLADLRRLVLLDTPLFQLDLDYFSHHTEGIEMNWASGSPSIGRLYSDRLIEPVRVPAAALPDLNAAGVHDLCRVTFRRIEQPRHIRL